MSPFDVSVARAERVTCPRCKGKGTVVKDGPSEWEFDSAWPCPLCTEDRTALKGSGVVFGGRETRRTA